MSGPARSLQGSVRLRKPTRGDLIALVNHAASEAGSALTCYWNDRNPDRAGDMEKRLKALQNLMLKAAGHFPPARRSPWTDEPNRQAEGRGSDATANTTNP